MSDIQNKAVKRQQTLYQDFFEDLASVRNSDIFNSENEKIFLSFLESYYPGSTFSFDYDLPDEVTEYKRCLNIQWINPPLHFDDEIDKNLLVDQLAMMLLSPYDPFIDSPEYEKMTLGMMVNIYLYDFGNIDLEKLRVRKITSGETNIFTRWAARQNLNNLSVPTDVNQYLVDFWLKH